MPTSLLVCLLVVAQTQLQGPAQGPREQRGKQQTHAGDTAEATRRNQRGTADSPLVVKVLPAPRNQEDLAREAREREEKAASDRSMVVWTTVSALTAVVLAFFNGINLWMLRKQGKDLLTQQGIMQSQADHMRDQAGATQASVAQMKDTAERQLRAYIVAKAGKLHTKRLGTGESRYLEWHPQIINTGQTPAYDVRLVATSGIRDEPLPPGASLITELDPKGVGSQGTLGRAQVIWPSCGVRVKESEMPTVVRRGSGKAWYVWGRVTYQDIFRQDHWTEFCFVADWKPDGTPISRVAPQGNDADRVG